MPAQVVFELANAIPERIFNGRDIHGALLDAVRQIHAPLAEALHEGEGGRAWSVSWDLVDDEQHKTEKLRLWLSLLRDQDVQTLRANAWRCPTPKVMLGGRGVIFERILMGVQPALDVVYDQLGARFEEATDVRITLLTPTFFRDGGEGLPDVTRLSASPE